jgi:hypothetical protein
MSVADVRHLDAVVAGLAEEVVNRTNARRAGDVKDSRASAATAARLDRPRLEELDDVRQGSDLRPCERCSA